MSCLLQSESTERKEKAPIREPRVSHLSTRFYFFCPQIAAARTTALWWTAILRTPTGKTVSTPQKSFCHQKKGPVPRRPYVTIGMSIPRVAAIHQINVSRKNRPSASLATFSLPQVPRNGNEPVRPYKSSNGPSFNSFLWGTHDRHIKHAVE